MTAGRHRVGAVVCVKAKDMKEAWCLAASDAEATAREIMNYAPGSKGPHQLIGPHHRCGREAGGFRRRCALFEPNHAPGFEIGSRQPSTSTRYCRTRSMSAGSRTRATCTRASTRGSSKGTYGIGCSKGFRNTSRRPTAFTHLKVAGAPSELAGERARQDQARVGEGLGALILPDTP